MAIDTRDLDTMTTAVLQRIVDADIGINNTNPGTVVHTIVEAILNEVDIEYYQLNQIYNALGIDNATGTDLDGLIEILGVVRKPATLATGTVTFSVTEASVSDIQIPYATIISTRQDSNGNIIEFITSSDAVLAAGQMSVDVSVVAIKTGHVFIPINGLSIMNNPIIGIQSVVNKSPIDSGTDAEDDDSLRVKAKQALSNLGRGTPAALRSALLNVIGVKDAMVIDMANGVGTANVVVVTDTIPPSDALNQTILDTVDTTKSAGINVTVTYPTIVHVNVTVTTTDGDNAVIGKAISDYIDTLGISDMFIINQMERFVLNVCAIDYMDITTIAPTSNVKITGTQIIRQGTITVNGVVYNG